MAALTKTFMSYSHRAHFANIRFNCASWEITMQVEFHRLTMFHAWKWKHWMRKSETLSLGVSISEDATEAEHLEPPNYSELPLPVEVHILFSYVWRD